ncbi:response regulator [Aquabacterium sp. A7-Y]|uniref:response regulator transcription factor n=1 Tax=Aquabacterium sp. A7-Y TaxID=1349605 RepID=UPI00223DFFBB|nr:response regulator [Aquabacterium sp. A7-Y]MCW7538551.1 response regulator [Aquabacterium sp. A7-Y]
MMPVIHIIDDDASQREALDRLLSASGYEVRSYGVASDYLVSPPDARPGCLLLDLQLPGVNGLELQAALHHHPAYDRPIVFMSGAADVRSSVQAMRAGAKQFLTKPIDRDLLLAALKDALDSDAALHESEMRARHLHAAIESLSSRERKVLDGVVAGRLHKQIADELGVSERTIKADRARVMRSLRVNTLPGLIKLLLASDLPSAGWRCKSARPGDKGAPR